MEYNFSDIEKKWQSWWKEHQPFRTDVDNTKPKYYVLDMFPYPSGAGLHVGHPLGYIASDIYARYQRLKGFNVLHPMGYDAYGLPAEQYAIQTGTHPAETTEKNILRYREQMDKIGFSYDWSRGVKTCDPDYYKWTQWVFIQLFKHWYNPDTNKAEPIDTLVVKIELEGHDEISPESWKNWDDKIRQQFLMNYRLAYLSDAWVNWCPELGTVLANDEVVNGLSVRGGHPVERKQMKQWFLRITPYAQRLLDGLNTIEWSDSIKEIQRNWIGRSEGANLFFPIKDHEEQLEIFTTRPDTIFGSSFMVLAPEHPMVEQITTPEKKQEVLAYTEAAKNRSERERMSEVKTITGVFTGAYCLNPFNQQPIPIWIADYVLAGYGTGAIMAVPAHDQRDYDFARHFDLPVVPVVTGGDVSEAAFEAKEGIMINSDFIDGLKVQDAIQSVINKAEELGIGTRSINFRLRDAIFSRQRYWGEPFPVFYKDGIPYTLDESELPLLLPEVDKYLPTESGEPPLARAKNWKTKEGYPLETTTMPGFAGSSGYYLRYMDPDNKREYFSRDAADYWQNVDLYIGGDEHATGHLIYARFWNKFLYDLGMAPNDEPFKKLINQGKIQGRSSLVYREKGTNRFVSAGLIKDYETIPMHVDISMVEEDKLDIEAFKQWRPDLTNAEFVLENGEYLCGHAIEKMSKSLYNVVNPDQIIADYGADTLRLYEMFLGPLEQSKPWDTHGIEGVFRFLKKLWRLFHDAQNEWCITDDKPTSEELKVLHKTIKKVEEDIERFSFNTAVSGFMICVNELTDLKCHKRAILRELVILISPYAPHIAEELWSLLGENGTVADAKFPVFKKEYLVEETFTYPVSFNGKLRFKLTMPAGAEKSSIEQAVLEAPEAQKWLQGKPPRKIIVVPNKIVNVVV
jgi:leucyl-tRNA synthetase